MKPAKSLYNLTEVKTRRFPWSRRTRRSSAEMDYALDAAHLARRSADDTPFDSDSFNKKSGRRGSAGRSLLSDIQALLAHAESQATRLAALEAKVEAQLPNVADGVGRLEERLQLVSVRVDEQSVLARKHGAQVSDVDRSLTRLGAKVKEMGGGGAGGPGGGRGALGGTHQDELHEDMNVVDDDVGQLLDENVNLDQMVERVRREQLNHLRNEQLGRNTRNTGSTNDLLKRAGSFSAGRRASKMVAKGALGGAQQATSKLKSLMTMTFDPDKPFRATWDVLMLLLVSYCVVAMPLQVAFEAQLGETTRTVQLYFDAFFDVLFLLDVLINARTAFTFEGVMVNNRSAILRRYLRTWFLLDIMASVPFAWMELFAPETVDGPWKLTRALRTLRVVKLMRVLKLPYFTAVFENFSRFNPGVLRVVKLVLVVLVVVHWYGCLWWYIGAVLEADVDSLWRPPAELLAMNASDEGAFVMQYFYSTYFAFSLLSGFAPLAVEPETLLETMFSIAGVILGIILSAMVVSSATSALSNLDAAAESHRRDLDAINGYLRFKRVPVELRRRINGFYNYVWASMQYMDQSHAIKGLPPQLKLQLLLAINMRQLARVPIFKHCDTRVILMIVPSAGRRRR